MNQEVTFKDRLFTVPELEMMAEVVDSCRALSRQELANTFCELLDWRRPNGKLKLWECKEFLQLLHEQQVIQLPALRTTKRAGSPTRVAGNELPIEQRRVTGSVGDVAPVRLKRVSQQQDHGLFRQLLAQHHYLGYKMAFGAQLRYLIEVSRPRPTVVGCLQLSSPAWKIAVRDHWIGWDEPARRANLQQIASQSRFLILPWVQVRNLASHVLALMLRQFPEDWQRVYAIRPLLVETLVDGQRYAGTCYRAANWQYLGWTQGRGRMDRQHRRHGASPKKVFVYPLSKHTRQALRQL